MPSLVQIGPVVWRRRFLNIFNIILHFHYFHYIYNIAVYVTQNKLTNFFLGMYNFIYIFAC